MIRTYIIQFMQAEPTRIFQDLIGQGTSGTVTKIYRDGQHFALKQIEKKFIRERGNLRQLLREVQTLKKIKHENVVEFKRFYETDTHYNLQMEYCDGKNLKQFLLSDYRNKVLPQNSKYFATKISLDLLHALVQINNCLISNRDIKPENVIVVQKDSKFSAKLIDFGEAKFDLKFFTSYVGTLRYMAPEVQAGKSYNEACDYWSLGMTLYEIFEGIRLQWEQQKHTSCPFWEKFQMTMGNNLNYFYNQLIWRQGISLTKSKTPKPFRQIIIGLLNPDPSQRFTLSKVIQILMDSFENDTELTRFLSQQEIVKEKAKLVESLGLEKNTKFVKRHLTQSIESINELYNSLLNPINKSLSEKEYGKKLEIVKLILALISKIEENLFVVMDKLKVEPDYIFYEILKDVMKKEQLTDLQYCIKNNLTLLKVNFQLHQFQISPEMERYMIQKFNPTLLQTLRKYF